MSHILQQIVHTKLAEVERAKALRPQAEVERAAAAAPSCRSLSHSLRTVPGGIIAEFKRRSPSKDWINREARVAEVIPAYTAAGAAALSVLTDTTYFGGSLDDLAEARRHTVLPLLRKDFVVDAYQLYEARAAGADACLLIAAVLGADACHQLAEQAHRIGLEVLLEVHAASELDACGPHVDVIGVNNRDLRRFCTDPALSAQLYPQLPQGPVRISESGLLQPAVARELRLLGYQGFLVGEAFMRQPQPGEALRAYLNELL